MKEGPGFFRGSPGDRAGSEVGLGSRFSQTAHLPAQVTEVPREVVRGFSHQKKVGTYLLGRSVGEGSFAKVKEALHLPTGEKVAVKVIDKKRVKADGYMRKNLRREGRLLQQIRHSHVVQLLEVLETEHCYYLVTEFCSGGDLMDYIAKRKHLEEPEVKKFIRQIVSAVDYLHRLGIIHRDLKIENLLLDENRNIKLIDFGLSNTIKVNSAPEGTAHAQEYLVTQCGSPAYAAPELLNHQKYGLQVDIWSIGVNMYAMLTGNLPFTVDPFSIRSLHRKMMASQMNPVPEELSTEGKDILHKFLTPDPAHRLTIAEALRHPWLTEGRNKPLDRSPFPNKLKAGDLEPEILKHMSENLGFRMSEVIRFVVGNMPSSACATYHLFRRKLLRHVVEEQKRLQGRVSGSDGASAKAAESGRISLELKSLSPRSSHQNTLPRQPRARENAAQTEVITSSESRSPERRRRSWEKSRALGKTPYRTNNVILSKDRAVPLSVRHSVDDDTANGKDNRGSITLRKTQPPPSKPKADNLITIPRHFTRTTKTSMKSFQRHPLAKLLPGTARENKESSGLKPHVADAAKQLSALAPTTLRPAALSRTSRRTTALMPLGRTSVPQKQDHGDQKERQLVDINQREPQSPVRLSILDKPFFEVDTTQDFRSMDPTSPTFRSLSFSKSKACSDSSTIPSSCSNKIPTINGIVTMQPTLRRPWRDEKWRLVENGKMDAVSGNVSDDVAGLTSGKEAQKVQTNRLLSTHASPIARRSLSKRSRSESLQQVTEDVSDAREQVTPVVGENVTCGCLMTLPPSIYVTEAKTLDRQSPERDFHLLPAISNSVTPRD